MSTALANFLFEALNVLLLAGALGWVLFKPVRAALDAERERHNHEDGERKRLLAEAETLARGTREQHAAAERETERSRQELLAAARREAAGIVEAARATQAAEQTRFDRELALRREADAATLADTLGRVAADSVRKLLATLDGPSLDRALVRAARAELDAIPAAGRVGARVESARPLDVESRRVLGAALGDDFPERVVAELGAGVRVTLPAGQVDATARSLARQAAKALRSAAAATPDEGPPATPEAAPGAAPPAAPVSTPAATSAATPGAVPVAPPSGPPAAKPAEKAKVGHG